MNMQNLDKDQLFANTVEICGEIVRYTLIFLVIVAILALASGDVWIGAGTMKEIITADSGANWYISLATTGVLAALLMIPVFGWYKKWKWWVIVLATVPALIPYIFDAYFDMKYADILIYGSAYVNTALLPAEERTVLFMLRGLFLAITTLGDPMTALIAAGFPILTNILTNGKSTSVPSTPKPVKPQAVSQTPKTRVVRAEDQSKLEPGLVRIHNRDGSGVRVVPESILQPAQQDTKSWQ